MGLSCLLIKMFSPSVTLLFLNEWWNISVWNSSKNFWALFRTFSNPFEIPHLTSKTVGLPLLCFISLRHIYQGQCLWASHLQCLFQPVSQLQHLKFGICFWLFYFFLLRFLLKHYPPKWKGRNHLASNLVFDKLHCLYLIFHSYHTLCFRFQKGCSQLLLKYLSVIRQCKENHIDSSACIKIISSIIGSWYSITQILLCILMFILSMLALLS